MAQSGANDDNSREREVKTKPLIVKTSASSAVGYVPYTATFYSLRGRMANGQSVHSGAIAADPKILPLGTVVHIEGMGTYVVKDTGGAIKGRRIDIWVPSRAQALKLGRKKIRVRIVSRRIKI
jgi:3D (Asp-Asp-Asp) domain-containing protein